jgi:hypothetical protein
MRHDHLSARDHEAEALIDSADGDALLGAVIRGDASQAEYIRFLSGTHAYLRWSGPLLAATARGLRRRGRQASLAAMVEGKSQEEAPHEGWVLADLRRCGVHPELVKLARPPAAVGAYVQFSLAMADAGSPAFFGSAYLLELLSARRARAAADSLRARAAIPHVDQAVSFLAGHGDADAAHVAALRQALAGIDDPEDGSDIVLGASLFRQLYPRFFPTADAGQEAAP